MIVTIDCGIGLLVFREPDNLKLKMLCDALKDYIEIYGVDKLNMFLSGDQSIDALKKEVSSLESDINAKDAEIDELERDLESMDDNTTTIDCGIGEIIWEADNLVLIDVMENLEAAIKKTTPRKVNEVLSAI